MNCLDVISSWVVIIGAALSLLLGFGSFVGIFYLIKGQK